MIMMTIDMIRLERWSYFPNDGMAMVFENFLTITIDGFWWDQPLATMVFRWFSNFWGPLTMVTEEKSTYFATNSISQQIAGKFKNYKKSNTAL